jgi:redox-sensitive transcriptional activator SoxR
VSGKFPKEAASRSRRCISGKPRACCKACARAATNAATTAASCAEIKATFDTLPSGRAPDHADWAAFSTLWRNDLEARIAELSQLRDQIDQCIGCGCLSLGDCPLRNPEDTLAREGPGPRLLVTPQD